VVYYVAATAVFYQHFSLLTVILRSMETSSRNYLFLGDVTELALRVGNLPRALSFKNRAPDCMYWLYRIKARIE